MPEGFKPTGLRKRGFKTTKVKAKRPKRFKMATGADDYTKRMSDVNHQTKLDDLERKRKKIRMQRSGATTVRKAKLKTK